MTAPDLASTSPDSRAAGIEMFASTQSRVTPKDAGDQAKVENDEMSVDDNTRSNKRGREYGVRKPHEAHGMCGVVRLSSVYMLVDVWLH
jgi:hypothetical protein